MPACDRLWSTLALVVVISGCGHTEAGLREDAVEAHQDARQDGDDDAYGDAREAYERYLTHYSDAKRSQDMKVRYGDVLMVLGETRRAGQVYSELAAADIHTDLQKEAAVKAIRAWEATVPKDAVYRIGDGSVEQLKVGRDYAKSEVSQDEKALVAAYDRFATIGAPEDQRLPLVKFGAGYIYFRRHNFAEASRHFSQLVDRWPSHPMARSATRMIISSLKVSQRYDQLAQLAQNLATNKKLIGLDRKLGDQLLSVAQWAGLRSGMLADEKARALPDRRRRREGRLAAAGRLVDTQRRFSGPEYGPQILFNAAVIHWQLSDYEGATKLYRRVLEVYPDSKLVGQVQAALHKIARQASSDDCVLEVHRRAHPAVEYLETCAKLESEADWPEVTNCYEELRHLHPNAPRHLKVKASLRRARALDRIGEFDQARTEREYVVSAHDTAKRRSDLHVRHWAAAAAHDLMEPEITKHLALKVTAKAASAVRKMNSAKKLVRRGGKLDAIATRYDDPCFRAIVAARKADIWFSLSRDLRKAAPGRPRGSDARSIADVEKRARKAARSALKIAKDFKVANRWTARAAVIARALAPQ